MENVEWLNYHHLFYFWRTAREGSLAKAASQLRLSHSTLSTQIRALENFVGGELFLRSGRALSLTALGKDVLGYADDIFRMGSELVEMTKARVSPQRAALRLGVVDTIPKTVALRFVEPVLRLPEHGPLSFHQDKLDSLLDKLAAGELHMILSDQPPPQGLMVHVYCRPLGETPVLMYGSQALVEKYKSGFPQSLEGAPMLLPSSGSNLRTQIDRWLMEHGIRVSMAGEFDDSASLRTFGLAGLGFFPVHAALVAEYDSISGIAQIGALCGVSERFYAISMERRVWRAEAKTLLEQVGQRLFEPLRV